MVIFLHSIKSMSLKPFTKTSEWCLEAAGDPGWRKPTTGIGCCAPATSGHGATAPPRILMNARRLMHVPKTRNDSLPHHAEPCITANSGALLPLWVLVA